MLYCVNVHFDGAKYFKIEATNEEEAKEKAMEAFDKLSPTELVECMADWFVDSTWLWKTHE